MFRFVVGHLTIAGAYCDTCSDFAGYAGAGGPGGRMRRPWHGGWHGVDGGAVRGAWLGRVMGGRPGGERNCWPVGGDVSEAERGRLPIICLKSDSGKFCGADRVATL